MGARVKGVLSNVQSNDEGLLLWVLEFVVNGTSDPDGLKGDELVTAVRTSAGKFTLTVRDKPALARGGFAQLAITGDATDIYAQVDDSALVSTGTVVVKTKTGTANADPADNTVVRVFLAVKKTTRRARGKVRP